MTFSFVRKSYYSRLITLCLIVTFVMTMVITPRAQAGVMGLPQPGTMVNLSSAYAPLMVTGLTIHPENPLLMDFIISTGNSGLNADQVKKESDRLIKYFLACLTIPENNQWVNLSPYEKQRIIPEDLGQTVLGQDMLAQDYILKQLTASLIYPEKNLGKNFWDTVYAKAGQMYGTTQIPVNTFNKVWILPDTAKVYEHNNTVFVVKSHLKVMLDEDYLALKKHQGQPGDMALAVSPSRLPSDSGLTVKAPQGNSHPTNALVSQIIRQIILPAIEKEVNTGKNFAQLRQIYNSMILAVWFKKNLKQALLNQVYTDKSKVNGVNADDPAIKEKIYKQYLQAYKKGVFNYIKEEVNQSSQEVIPRKYFSGGLATVDAAMLQSATTDEAMAAFDDLPEGNRDFKVSGLTQPGSANQAVTVETLPLVPTNQIRPVKFGTSGDRFVEQTWAEQGIDSADHLNRIGTGIAEYFNQATPGKIMLIGYDPRQRNPESAKALAGLYAANGIKVKIVSAESTPTPVLGFMVHQDENIGGVTILTASHSPWTDRGIKFSPAYGGAAPTAMTDQIQVFANQATEYKTTDYEKAKLQGLIIEVSPEEVQRIYVDDYVVPRLKKLGAWDDIVNFIKQNPSFEMVLDPMQGTGVRYLKAIYEALAQAVGRNFYTMVNTNNTDIHFSDVNGEPNPTIKKSRAVFEQTVQQRIKEGKRVMGASVDADSDRFGNIDSNGEFIPTNDMIALIAYFLKKEIGLSGAIGKTVATSNFVNAIANHFNMELDEEPVGFKYFVDNVISRGRKYLIAGEESSHVAIGPFIDSWDDGFVVGLMGLWITAKTGKSLTEYKDLIQKTLDQKFVIETLTIRGKDDSIKEDINAKIARTKEELKLGKSISELDIVQEIEPLIQQIESLQGQRVVDIITKDGVKLVLTSGDWILMRPSGTEPAVKLYVEVAGKYNSSSAQMKQKFDQLVAVGRKVIGADKAMTGVLTKNKAAEVESNNKQQSEIQSRPSSGSKQATTGFAPAWVRGYADLTQETPTSDKAALGKIPGGIDLNSKHLKMESSGQKVNITFDPAMIEQFKRGDFSGVRIQILDVVPINLMPLLGLKEA